MPVQSGYVVCPLNAHHVILKKRIQTHLTKCERQHDMTKKSKCPYNMTHIVDTIVFPHHLETCPDAKIVHEYTYNTDQKPLTGILPLEDIIKHQETLDFDEESWETSTRNGPGYDPTKHIDEKMVLRHLSVASKKERKDFRLAERKRHQFEMSIASDSESTSLVAESELQLNKNLRRPKTQSKTMSLESLSMGGLKKELIRVSQKRLQNTSCILVEETEVHEIQKLNDENSDDKVIDNIANDLDKTKLNDKKDNNEKIKRLGRLATKFPNLDKGKEIGTIEHDNSSKNSKKIPGETYTVLMPWSSSKKINN